MVLEISRWNESVATKNKSGLNRLCRIGNNSTLAAIPANCETLVGRLTLDHTTDLSQLWKLYNVTRIYGQLVIQNASITSLAALWKLEYIINLTGPNLLEKKFFTSWFLLFLKKGYGFLFKTLFKSTVQDNFGGIRYFRNSGR
ncbi:unnamed protein product [Haemonchus placei]|uniref:Receptor L-domain domain-containing protein n=1 Tax=Haemonchus placei TaxID=6290 RepID=A0A3P7X2A2_HAEPC|nr:unnamed protein product [Haemonchus placei]